MLTIYEFREGALKAQTGLPRITEEVVWIDLLNPTADEEEVVERALKVEVRRARSRRRSRLRAASIRRTALTS
ncbi:hypothetical protein [Methyloceanibacter marginalis]|uniref:hypothetical protein n=1 Tax=Methyloceanibacter marginalis TaxID=1774971 RepID=UPI00114CC1E9|nr:hypothetical protein [Methyloceanibacter marginalis]